MQPTPAEFREKLRAWRERIQRPMPWKGEKDPYRIWISEVILQQTRVEQGWKYYEAFIRRFPDVQTLAAASEAEVFKLWEGLGYYSRARNLMRCAQILQEQFGGQLPQQLEQLLTLPGIGPYTAAALASFAFDAPHAVVDGNVERILARIFGVELPAGSPAGKKAFQALAQTLLDAEEPGAHNQAMMDFGATHCLPRNPLCPSCLFQEHCAAFLQKRVAELPVKVKKQAKKQRFFHYLVLKHEDIVYIRQRPQGDIWAQLWEFPMLETPELELPFQELIESLAPSISHSISSEPPQVSNIHRQTLSHQSIAARFWEISLPHAPSGSIPPEWQPVSWATLQQIAFPRLIRWFLEEKNRHLSLF